MRILIVYATTEGQTAKIAAYAEDRYRAEGHEVTCLKAEDAGGVHATDFNAVLLAGSVHAGQYQGALSAFAKAETAALPKVRTLFLSVSLTAAGADPDDWAELEACVARFQHETGWTPGQVAHVAGALRFSEYDFFRYWAMRWIASQRDEDATPGADREYTDWSKLADVLDAFLA